MTCMHRQVRNPQDVAQRESIGRGVLQPDIAANGCDANRVGMTHSQGDSNGIIQAGVTVKNDSASGGLTSHRVNLADRGQPRLR